MGIRGERFMRSLEFHLGVYFASYEKGEQI